MRLIAASAEAGMPLTHPDAVDRLSDPTYKAVIEASIEQVVAFREEADRRAQAKSKSKGRR